MSYQDQARELRARLYNPPNAWRPSGNQIPRTGSPIIQIEPIRSSRLALDILCEFCSCQFNVSRADILSPTRLQHIVLARHMVCYLASRHFGMTFYKIGSFLDRDHTSVMAGRNRMTTLLAIEGAPYDRLREIEREFLDLYYPAFAISCFRKSNLERKGAGKGGVSKRRLYGLESRIGGRILKAKIRAASQADQGRI